MSRPEHLAPPELFYNDVEAKKYTQNSRIATIQAEMALRCLELLALPEEKTCFLLDIGCGSGLSGEILDEEGHLWVGCDVAPSMLEVAAEREVEGDLFLQDIGQGFGYRPGTFDGAVSVSVLQWLCNADKSSHVPHKRLARFFSTLYTALARGARAIFQFYPETDAQLEMIMTAATRSGFSGGLVVDYPNSKKAKKYYLCLFAGQGEGRQEVPQGLRDEHETEATSVSYTSKGKEFRTQGRKSRKPIKDKDWVLHKKELNRQRGRTDVPTDSKYTARKRRPRF